MEQVRKILLLELWIPVAIAGLMVLVFETGLMAEGFAACEKHVEFVCLSIMELVTICAIPFALRLFKFGAIHRRLVSDDKVRQLRIWGSVRMAMLCVPMIANLVLYYCFVHAGFGYMGIILLLALFFVYPTSSRCYNETDDSHC